MSSKTKQKPGAMKDADNKSDKHNHHPKPTPCGYEVAPGVCSIPGKSGKQPYDCANCNTGTDQNIRAVSKAEGKG